MSTETRIILSNGEFVRETIQRQSLGPQDSILQEIAGTNQNTIFGAFSFPLNLTSTIRRDESYLNVEESYQAPVGLVSMEETLIIFNKLPYIPVLAYYQPIVQHYNLTGETRNKEVTKNRIARLTPVIKPILTQSGPSENHHLMAPRLTSLPGERFFFVTTWVQGQLGRSYFLILQDKNVCRPGTSAPNLVPPPIPNVSQGDASICFGYIRNNMDNSKAPYDKHQWLLHQFLETPGNHDLANDYTYLNLTFTLPDLDCPWFHSRWSNHPSNTSMPTISNTLFDFFLKVTPTDLQVQYQEEIKSLNIYESTDTTTGESPTSAEATDTGGGPDNLGADLSRNPGSEEEVRDDPDAELSERDDDNDDDEDND